MLVARSVFSELGSMTIVGLVGGAVGAAFASRFITPLVFGVSPTDMWSVTAPLICLLLACALSALIPTVRATRIDPTIALRSD
jgi:ABC-type antimicrobial peptide transport system permease subunit